MSFLRTIIGISAIVVSTVTIAFPMAAAPVHISGITVDHAAQPGTPTDASISLNQLMNVKLWNITCHFTVNEINGASNPSSASPLAFRAGVQYNYGTQISGQGYSAQGITATSGTIVFKSVIYGMLVNNKISPNALDFKNIDATGNVVITGCDATPQL